MVQCERIVNGKLASRIRAGYAPKNFNVAHQLAINWLKKELFRMSIKKKRFKAVLNDDFRESIIFPL
jgi:hypothetical protein